jgi:hypothetical protein
MFITKNDIDNTLLFFSNFGVPVPQELQEKADKFYEDPVGFNDEGELNEFKQSLCNVIVKYREGHPILKRDVFDGLALKSEEIVYEMQFNEDLREVLNEE